ncbi:MAG TPA: PRC-barrel domain-containing protein [Azospirillum sp.]
MKRMMIVTVAVLAATCGAALAQTATAPAAEPPAAAPVTTLGVPLVEDMVGRTVIDTDGQALGTVHDVLLDPNGAARRLVLDRAGGAGRVAIDFTDVRMRSDSADLHVADLRAADLARLPPFEYDDDAVSLNRGDPDADARPPR